jgi:hypothetical protein
VTSPSAQQVDVSAAIGGVNAGQIAVGTNIRQQWVQLNVTISGDDPASLDRLEDAVRLDRIPDRVTRWGKDFPRLIGREGVVAAATAAVAERESVSAYGDAKIGKSVFLRHLAPRIGAVFRDGVVRLPAGGMRWQDIGQDIVKSFYRSRVWIYLSPAELDRLLADLDALIIVDDVSPDADIEQLTTIVPNATFVLASSQRLLAGESRGLLLTGIDPAAVPDLVRDTLTRLGETAPVVDPGAAQRIGMALDNHPDRIITAVQHAFERGVDLHTLAGEIETDRDTTAARRVAGLTAQQRALVDAVDALGGAPIGAEHVAAVVPGATLDQMKELVHRRQFRTASPQVRVDPWLRAAYDGHELDRDAFRARYLDHFVGWIRDKAESTSAVTAEAQAILYLLDWAERTGRASGALALSAAAEGAFALDGRWGAWSRLTGHRVRAATKLGLEAEAAIAINQSGIQLLGDDDWPRARVAFRESMARALAANAPALAEVARHNLEVIDGPLLPPRDDDGRPRTDGADGITLPRPLVMLGLAGIAVVAGDRRAAGVLPKDRFSDRTRVPALHGVGGGRRR